MPEEDDLRSSRNHCLKDGNPPEECEPEPVVTEAAALCIAAPELVGERTDEPTVHFRYIEDAVASSISEQHRKADGAPSRQPNEPHMCGHFVWWVMRSEGHEVSHDVHIDPWTGEVRHRATLRKRVIFFPGTDPPPEQEP